MKPGEFKLKGVLDSNSNYGQDLINDREQKADYIVKNASPVFSADNFTKVRVSPTGIEVSFHGRKGELLGRKKHKFSPPST